MMKKLVAFVLMIQFLQPMNAQAGPLDVGVGEYSKTGTDVSEYVYQNNLKDVLIPVYLLGAVNKPGIYHVPQDTNLVALLALAGGPTKDAELEKITLKRFASGNSAKSSPFTVTELNLVESLQNDHAVTAALSGNDVIMIPAKEPLISSNTVTLVSIAVSIVGIIVSIALINRYSSR